MWSFESGQRQPICILDLAALVYNLGAYTFHSRSDLYGNGIQSSEQIHQYFLIGFRLVLLEDLKLWSVDQQLCQPLVVCLLLGVFRKGHNMGAATPLSLYPLNHLAVIHIVIKVWDTLLFTSETHLNYFFLNACLRIETNKAAGRIRRAGFISVHPLNVCALLLFGQLALPYPPPPPTTQLLLVLCWPGVVQLCLVIFLSVGVFSPGKRHSL